MRRGMHGSNEGYRLLVAPSPCRDGALAQVGADALATDQVLSTVFYVVSNTRNEKAGAWAASCVNNVSRALGDRIIQRSPGEPRAFYIDLVHGCQHNRLLAIPGRGCGRRVVRKS